MHVRWQASLEVAERQKLEAQFRLEHGERLDGSTWRYDLVEPSADIIRTLVRDPAVEDTHHIDRASFTVSDAERTARRGRIPYGGTLVAAADTVAIALVAFAALLTLVGLSGASSADPWAGLRGVLLGVDGRLVASEGRLVPYFVLASLGLAVYGVALWFPPTNADDLSYLSSVASIGNPLYYFVANPDGGSTYRPLLNLSMWPIYRIFGVWAVPNQVINLLLHLVNVCLLYVIVRREQRDTAVAVLVAAVFMISWYTFYGATWTSDRPMVLTGLFLLLLVGYLSRRDELAGQASGVPINLSLIVALSVLALLSKESGLVVPTIAMLFAVMPGNVARLAPRQRLRLGVVTASIIGLYLALRMLIFASDFASYSQDGYMFLGLVHYVDSDDLPPLLRYLNFAENVIKHTFAPVLPVFAETGSLISWESLPMALPVIVSTILLFALAARRPLSRLQWIALTVIVVNAVAHFALFRYRLHYLSHAAFCLFVASSPGLGNGHGNRLRTLAVKTLAIVALLGSILWVNQMLSRYTLDRERALDALSTEGVERYGDVAREVLETYR